MTAAKGAKALSLAHLPVIGATAAMVLTAAAIVAATGPSNLAASTKGDFSLASTPNSRTAQQGQVASYTIDESKLSGFKDPVTLSASNLPSGSSASFSPSTLDTKSSSNLSVTVGRSTPVATYDNLTVTGTGGGVTKSITLTMVVQAATPSTSPSFALTSTPASATMLPGDTAAYTVAATAQNGFTGAIAFSVSGGPSGSTATFSPASVNAGGATNMQVATKSNSPSGNYTLVITGTSGTVSQTASVALNLSAGGKQFTITAPPTVLPGPGAGMPLNLSIANPNNQALNITNLTVSIQSVAKAVGAPAGTCSIADYAVSQFTGSYPLVVQPGLATSLSNLVSDSAQWPRLNMLETGSRQDACKGAVVTLSFTGAGQS